MSRKGEIGRKGTRETDRGGKEREAEIKRSSIYYLVFLDRIEYSSTSAVSWTQKTCSG